MKKARGGGGGGGQEERRYCWLGTISPFPVVFSKDLSRRLHFLETFCPSSLMHLRKVRKVVGGFGNKRLHL